MFGLTNKYTIWLFDPASRVGPCQDKLITIVSVFCLCNQPSHRQTFPLLSFVNPTDPPTSSLSSLMRGCDRGAQQTCFTDQRSCDKTETRQGASVDTRHQNSMQAGFQWLPVFSPAPHKSLTSLQNKKKKVKRGLEIMDITLSVQTWVSTQTKKFYF